MTAPSRLEAVLRRDRQVVAGILVAVAVASWLYVLAGAGTGMLPHKMAALIPSQQGMYASPAWTPGYALVMFSMWWLMMIAMMLPSAAPMVLLHAAVTRKALAGNANSVPASGDNGVYSSTIAFIAGYLVMWGGFSLVAVLAQWGLERTELLSTMMVSTSRLLGSGLLLAAGAWQLTPLKSACLRQCRSPISFVTSRWRPGAGGAFRMGLEHGVFCLGCCWFLMALLFFAGVMNLVWIAGLAIFVLVEKLLPAGATIGKVAGVLLIGWGAWLGFTAF